MGCGVAEATGLGFVCLVVLNPRVLSANRVDFEFFFCFINIPILYTGVMGWPGLSLFCCCYKPYFEFHQFPLPQRSVFTADDPGPYEPDDSIAADSLPTMVFVEVTEKDVYDSSTWLGYAKESFKGIRVYMAYACEGGGLDGYASNRIYSILYQWVHSITLIRDSD